jgi:hypothetical protein
MLRGNGGVVRKYLARPTTPQINRLNQLLAGGSICYFDVMIRRES